MKLLAAALLAAAVLSSCGAPSDQRGESAGQIEVRTREDLDRYAGKDVSVEGTFGHIGAKHATITLESGLVISVPHFDLFRRGDDWLKYVGQPVRMEGILHTETAGTSGVTGPVLDIRRFEALTP